MPSLLVDEIHRFPIFEYRCPNCLTDYGTQKQSVCAKCGASFHEGAWRYPIRRETSQKIVYSYYMRAIGKDPKKRKFKSPKARSRYAHNVLAPLLTSLQRKVLFIYFTEFFNNGFEEGDFSAWDGTLTSGGCTSEILNTDPHCGTYHAHFALDADGQKAQAYWNDGGTLSETTLYMRAYIKINAFPTNTGHRFGVSFWNDGGTDLVCCLRFVYSDPNWYLGIEGASGWGYATDTGSTVVTTGTWYCVEIMSTVANSPDGEHYFWLDGSEECSLTGLATANRDTDIDYTTVGFFYLSSESPDIYVDCVIVADAYIGVEEEEAGFIHYGSLASKMEVLGML